MNQKPMPPFALVLTMLLGLMGAGCSTAPVKQLPQKLSIPQTTRVETFAYDIVPDGIGQYSFPKAMARQVIETQSCAPLTAGDKSRIYLPVDFTKQTLCNVSKAGSSTVVIALGFGVPYESYPFLDTMKLTLGPDTFTNEYREVQEIKTLNQNEYKKYPEVDLGSPDFARNAATIASDLSALLKGPSQELKSAFSKLKE